MSVTLSSTARNTIVDAITALLNGGSIVLLTSGNVEVATLGFGSPAFGAASSGSAVANSITSDTSATGGTAAKVSFRNSSNVEVLQGTVGITGSGADLTAASVVITAGETVSISSLSFSQPAS